MLRHLGPIAVCACIVASVGCDGGKLTAPAPPPLEFGGRVVNADAGDPVANVRVSVEGVRIPAGSVVPTASATTGGDGTFTLSVSLPSDWSSVSLKLSGPGYDDGGVRFEPNTAGTRTEIRIYPTLVIRPGESRLVRVEPTVTRCGFAGPFSCRRFLVDAPPGERVELEILTHDTSKPMGLAESGWEETTVPRLMVAPGGGAYVYGPGTATLTARR